MPLPDNFLDSNKGNLRSILQHAGVAQAAIHVERVGVTKQQQTLHESEDDERGSDGVDETIVVYGIGSLTKVLNALLISIIVDKLPYSNEPDNAPYRELRKRFPDPWATTFTTLFNYFSDLKMSPLPKNPTLRQVLIHFNSLPPMNYLLLAPDGTSLMSTQEFLKVVPVLTAAVYGHRKGDYLKYSNGNYILIGLLIEAIAPKQDTLHTLMKKHIFDPLGMTHTYMDRPDLSKIPYARPQVVSAKARRELINPPAYTADALVNPAMGAWSCTRDIAILLRKLLHSLNGDDLTFSRDFVLPLFRAEGLLDDSGSDDGYSLCGIYTTLDTWIPGSKSINRLVTPTKVCSAYQLGLRPHGGPGKPYRVGAYYQAGAVNGYASCYYLIPKHNTFVIVLTNTSGRTDASDHISRFILQEIFDLERARQYRLSLAKHFFDRRLGLRLSDLNVTVDILDMASRAKKEGQSLLEEWERVDSEADIANAPSLELEGTYSNGLTKQLIIIRIHNGHFIVKIKAGASVSRDIGLHRTGDHTFRLYPSDEDGFTIDRYDFFGWRELNFNMSTEKDKSEKRRVVRIERRCDLLPSTRVYKRIAEGSSSSG